MIDNNREKKDVHAGRDRQLRIIRDCSSAIAAIARTVLILLLVLSMAGCVGRRITKANVDEVAEGMSKKQVESILGPPTELDNKDFLIMKKTIYIYRQGKDTVTVVFKDDKVVEKQSTLAD
jgi:outer membrane protein assembly factor BamE (lipoprotein component of BamABCDE complex)